MFCQSSPQSNLQTPRSTLLISTSLLHMQYTYVFVMNINNQPYLVHQQGCGHLFGDNKSHQWLFGINKNQHMHGLCLVTLQSLTVSNFWLFAMSSALTMAKSLIRRNTRMMHLITIQCIQFFHYYMVCRTPAPWTTKLPQNSTYKSKC